MKRILLFCFLSAFISGFSQNCSNLKGDWRNELNSILHIDNVDGTTGQITGTYKLSTGQVFPLIGYAQLNVPASDGISTLINFSVSFKSYYSMTAWSGYCKVVNGVPTLHTIWHLVSAKADASYKHITTDVDNFVPVKKP